MVRYSILLVLFAFAVSCGNKKPEPKSGDSATSGDASNQDVADKNSKEVAQAKKGISDWLGKEASKRVMASVGSLSREIGFNIAKDKKVMSELKKPIKVILKNKQVKKKNEKIADKATSGFANKMKLGWKALTSGGVRAYKTKVKKLTNRVGQEVITEHIEKKVLRDKRMADVIKKIMPALKLQAKLATASLQENLSPRVAQKLFGISLKISVAGKADKTAEKVAAWTTSCNGHVEAEVEQLFKKMAVLPSLKSAVSGLAADVIGHKRTSDELATMMLHIMDDKDAYNAMVKAYEASAFDKGEDKVRAAIQKIVDMPVVDDELFAALSRLAEAKGAGAVMEKHFVNVGEDTAIAELIDEFIINLLVTCGDPTKS